MKRLDIIGAEVYAVLSKVSKEFYNKVPSNIINMFEKYKENSDKIQLQDDIEFEKQNISKEAKDIIFAISLNYWLKEEERKEVLIKLKENEKVLNEKYNIENMFRKNSKENIDIDTENKNIIKEEKEKWYIKIINKIKALFRK